MPYVSHNDRENTLAYGANSAGNLNFELTTIILDYLKEKGLKYQTINDIVGALEGCKQEFIRRIVAPYEDIKIQENGDIFLYMAFNMELELKGIKYEP